MKASRLALGAVLCACSTVRGATVEARYDDHFPLPAEGMVLEWEGDKGPTLNALIAEFGRVTGHAIVVTRESQAQVDHKHCGLQRSGAGRIDVPPEEVYAFVEGILWHHQFLLIDLHPGEPRLVAIRSLETAERNTTRDSAFYVPVERIEIYRRHPAMLVTTLLRMPPQSDVRALSNSMRTMLTDANTQQIIPVGQSALILTGTGPNVADLVRVLREVGEHDATLGPVDEVGSEQKPGPEKKQG